MGVLGGYLCWKVVLEFWFRHPKCHFWYPQNGQNGVILAIHSKSWWPWWPDSANFFHFPPKFRLRTRKPSRLHCTKQVALYISGQQQWLCSDQKASGGGAHTAILCLVFVFNINTSDLLYFDIMLLKTPDLCNLRTFVAIFFLSRFTHIFRQFLEAKKQTPPIYPLLECMGAENTSDEASFSVWFPLSPFSWSSSAKTRKESRFSWKTFASPR